MWLNISLSWNVREQYVFWLFFKKGLCSATSFERSRWELSIDVAEHRSILKNNHKTYNPRFSFTPKTGIAFPKTGVFCFYCERGPVHRRYGTEADSFCMNTAAQLLVVFCQRKTRLSLALSPAKLSYFGRLAVWKAVDCRSDCYQTFRTLQSKKGRKKYC